MAFRRMNTTHKTTPADMDPPGLCLSKICTFLRACANYARTLGRCRRPCEGFSASLLSHRLDARHTGDAFQKMHHVRDVDGAALVHITGNTLGSSESTSISTRKILVSFFTFLFPVHFHGFRRYCFGCFSLFYHAISSKKATFFSWISSFNTFATLSLFIP